MSGRQLATNGAEPFRIGKVLQGGLQVLSRNIVPFGSMALVFVVPAFAFEHAMLSVSADLEISAYAARGISLSFGVVLLLLLMAAIVFGTIRELTGNRASLGECIRQGVGLVRRAVGAVFMMLVTIVLTMAIFALVGTLIGYLVGDVRFLAVFAAQIAPAFVIVFLWVAIPVAVVERPGALRSLLRSVQLTKGSRWRVFGTIVTLTLILLVVTAIMTSLWRFAAESFVVRSAFVWAEWAFTWALCGAVSAISYHNLLLSKEEMDAEQIAAALD